MGDNNGSDRENPKAEEAKENKEKREEKRPPQVEPNVGTGDVPPPPP